jgi:hypothetical protein
VAGFKATYTVIHSVDGNRRVHRTSCQDVRHEAFCAEVVFPVEVDAQLGHDAAAAALLAATWADCMEPGDTPAEFAEFTEFLPCTALDCPAPTPGKVEDMTAVTSPVRFPTTSVVTSAVRTVLGISGPGLNARTRIVGTIYLTSANLPQGSDTTPEQLAASLDGWPGLVDTTSVGVRVTTPRELTEAQWEKFERKLGAGAATVVEDDQTVDAPAPVEVDEPEQLSLDQDQADVDEVAELETEPVEDVDASHLDDENQDVDDEPSADQDDDDASAEESAPAPLVLVQPEQPSDDQATAEESAPVAVDLVQREDAPVEDAPVEDGRARFARHLQHAEQAERDRALLADLEPDFDPRSFDGPALAELGPDVQVTADQLEPTRVIYRYTDTSRGKLRTLSPCCDHFLTLPMTAGQVAPATCPWCRVRYLVTIEDESDRAVFTVLGEVLCVSQYYPGRGKGRRKAS